MTMVYYNKLPTLLRWWLYDNVAKSYEEKKYMLTSKEKRKIENIMVQIINKSPNGINTRTLISKVLNLVTNTIPKANRHHIAGMIAWVLEYYNFNLIIRTPGYSVIA